MSASTTELSFEKWQGCLNDFLLISSTAHTLLSVMKLLTAHASKICARDGSGVGADGIILVCAGEKYMMWIINKDGSFAKNCGNGLRCAAMAFFRSHAQDRLEIALGGNMISCRLFSPSPQRVLVATDMGTVQVNTQNDWYDSIREFVGQTMQELSLPTLTEHFAVCEIGNRHIVFFTSRPQYLEKIASHLQCFDAGAGINVHLAWPRKGSKGTVYNARTWERGVRITASCGSGACAIAAAVLAETAEEIGPEKWLKIVTPGGLLQVKKNTMTEHFVLAGPAQYVFRGVINL